MLVVRFRKEEDGHHLLNKIKRMREDIEHVEEMLNDCIEDEDINYRHTDRYYDRDDRRMRRDHRINDEEYRRSRM